jgi:hypothetical protein
MSPTAPGAMALLEKYTDLNRGMDKARRENSLTKSKMESVRQQIERLRVERQDMEAQTLDAREDTVDLHKDVQEALAKLRELEDKHAQALLEKMGAQRHLDFSKQYVEEQRQRFLETSRDFRTCCKRMRLSASAVGEDMVTSKAFLERYGGCYSDDESDGTQKDTELEQVMDEHRRRKDARDEAGRVLRALQVKEQGSSERSSSRSERKGQLLAQLDRVHRDNVDLEQQLKSLDQQTREAREMAHNLEKGEFQYIAIFAMDYYTISASVLFHNAVDVTRRTSNSGRYGGAPHSFSSVPTFQNPITPSPYTAPRSAQQTGRRTVPRNPYASRCASVSQSQPDVVMGREWTPADRVAHPHLTGRVRLDRQFGSALEIISGGNGDFSGPPESNQATAYKTINNPILLDDNDDDDDDELLSYVAFIKK